MDEQELERRLRGGLERRAGEADTGAPVLDRVRAEVGARRRTRWGVGAAAAAVVVVAGGVTVAAQQGDGSGGPEVATPGPTTSGIAPPGRWRTEHWADVAVDVPANWGYGGAPYDRGAACGPAAIVGPDGQQLRGRNGRGWVGRPVMLTDICATVPDAWEPQAPYVWLGAEVEPGTYEYDNGYVQETVEAGGTTVTVGADDRGLRERILGTVRAGETCRSELEVEGEILHDPGSGEPAGLRVCVYRETDWRRPDGVATLAYAGELGADALAAYDRSLADAPEPRDQCPAADYVESTWVVLEVVDADGDVVRQDVVHLVCPGIDVDARRLGDLETVPLTEDRVRPWAVGGIPAVVHSGNGEDWMWRYFIGPQG